MSRFIATAPIGTKPPGLGMDVVRACMFGLLIMGISRIHQVYGFLTVLHLGNLMVALPVLLMTFNSRNIAKGWTKRIQTRLVAGILISTLGSIAFGISQGGAFYAFKMNVSTVFITALLLAATIRGIRDLRIIMWGSVVGSACLVYLSLFVFKVKQEGAIERLAGQASWDSNDIGLLMVSGLPLAMLCFRTAGSKFGKLFAGGTVIGMASTIALTGSRGAFLGLGMVIVAYLFTLRGGSAPGRIITVAVLVGGVVFSAPEGYWKQMETIGDSQEDYNTFARQGRKQLAMRGMGYMMDHPFFGLGVGQFGRAEGTLTDFAKNWNVEMAGIKWSAAHNSYVQIGAELGVPGFLMFISLVGGCIIIPFRLRKKVPMSWATGDWEQRFLFHALSFFPLAAIGFATSGAFVSFAFNDPVYFLAAMCGGLSASVERKLAEVGGTAVTGAPQPAQHYRRPGFRRGPNRQPQPAYASTRQPYPS